MAPIVIFLHEFFNRALALLFIIGTQHSVRATNLCNARRHGYGNKAYILDFHSKYWMRPSISPFCDVYNCL